MIDTAARSGDVTAIGQVHADDHRLVEVRLIVPSTVRRAGRGNVSLVLADPEVDIEGATLLWLVTTNKGWAHMRGEADVAGGTGRLPFRADLFAGAAMADGGPDRFALRMYAAGDDPNRASPIHKFAGWMPVGSIRI
jgi:hypothetical protein